jgi:hypothetical protein
MALVSRFSSEYRVRADELAGRPRFAPVLKVGVESRKVRTSESRVIANGNPR